MAGIKLNIRRTKSNQVANDPTASATKTQQHSVCNKPKNETRQVGNGSTWSSQHQKPSPPQTLTESIKTTRSECSDLTADDDFFDEPFNNEGIFSLLANDTATKLSNSRILGDNTDGATCSGAEFRGNSSKFQTIIEFKDPGPSQHQNRCSWIASSWNSDAENKEDELDESVYTLLDCEEDQEQFMKLSLHDVLVEDELSFRKSLVWNDEEK